MEEEDKMPTIFKPGELEYKRDKYNSSQFDLLTALPNLGKRVEAKHLAFDVRKLNPGCLSFPYHFHRNAEELMIIISGSLAMRSPLGFHVILQGETVFMEKGASGAHQFYNHTSLPCSYLDVKTLLGLDIVEYPDSGKIMISPTGEAFDKKSQVDYLKGEKNAKSKWKDFLKSHRP
jgi:uncharacterized cupin superfamily protein